MGTYLKKHIPALALALPFAFLGTSAQADGYFCSSRLGPLAGGYSMCVGAVAGAGGGTVETTTTKIIQPDAFSDAPVSASQMSTGSGWAAGFASAGSSADLGMLGGSATAESLNAVTPVDGTSYARANAKTDAAFSDSGILVSAAGAPVGTPVSLRIIIDAAGSFAGGPINAAPSEATVTLSVFINDRISDGTRGLLSKFTPFVVLPVDLTEIHVGDRLAFGLRLETRAGATNEKLPDVSYMSSKAVDVSARLYVDVLSANANFVSASGHLYARGEAPAPGRASAPVLGTATAGDSQATVSFAAPTSAGASAITGYTVISSPGGITATGTASPITVTGLTNGTAYTFTVTASNALGMGATSLPSNSVTPTANPASALDPAPIPIIGAATAGDTQATVNFTATPSVGTSAITGYTVIASPGGVTATGTASPITVTGLTNGTTYTFTVTSSNATGTSTASAPSNSVTPTAGPAPAPAPASGGGGSASIPLLLALSAAYGWRHRRNRRRWKPLSTTNHP